MGEIFDAAPLATVTPEATTVVGGEFEEVE